MRKYSFLAILFVLVLIVGCSDQAVEEQPVIDVQEEIEPVPQPNQITGTVAAEQDIPEPEEPEVSPRDCTLLSHEEINGITGMNVLSESRFTEYSANKCERKWSAGNKEKTVTLAVWTQTFSKTKNDLLKCYTFDSYEAIDDLGGHYACWYPSGKAVNFGKGDYKFQVSCSGEGCSQATMIKLAEMVVEKI